MMMKSLAGYLAPQVGLTLGTNLFIGELGGEQPDGIYMVTGASIPPENELDTETQMIDFYSRYGNSDAGYNKLREIYRVLHRKIAYTYDIYEVYLSDAQGQIEDLDRDSNQRKIWRLSFRFIYHETTNIS